MISGHSGRCTSNFVFPLFGEGALSPADDVLDLAVAAVLVNLLGWHWEFLPAFAAELVPGLDLVPFWTLASSTFTANGSNGNHRIRTSSWASGSRRRVQIFLDMGRSADRGENANE